MSLPTYPEYKDSGVEWLGDVPTQWQLRRLAFFFDERREKVSDVDFPPLSVTKSGIVPQLETAAKTDDGSNRKLVRVGDFVINSRSDRKGSAGCARQDGSVSLISTVLRPTADINVEFAHHLLRSIPFQEEFYRYGKGIVADLWSTNYSEMRNIFLAMPDPSEQAAIATFLDRETGKIDALIAEQEKLIALLAEKRQATISHAVTRGLNPNAPMKDSGIAWLGEVPAHWATRQLKHLCTMLKDGTHLPPARVDDGVPLLSVRNIDHSIFAFRDDDSMISVDDFMELCKAFVPEADDVLLAIVGATLGKVAMVPPGLPDFHIQRSVAIFRANSTLSPKWLFYCIRSGAFQRLLWQYVGYSAQPGIYLGTLQNFKIPVPLMPEQIELCAMLDREIAKLESLTAEANRAVTLLKERRGALIAAAVTGQIDVRQVA